MVQRNKKIILKANLSCKDLFFVPFSLDKIAENSVFYTNSSIKFNKEEIITQANSSMIKGNYLEASKYYQLFLDQGYSDPSVFANYGIIFQTSGQLNKAIELYLKSINLYPQSPHAYSHIGTIYKDLGKLKESESVLKKAIELDPFFTDAYFNLANTLRASGDYPEAIFNYKKALELNPDFAKAKSVLIECKAQICDWSDLNNQNYWLKDLGIKGGSIEPMSTMYAEDNASKQLQRSQNLYKKRFARQEKLIKNKKHKKIRIGYFSADFKDHPVMHLIYRIFELHDNSSFDIYIYSFNAEENKFTKSLKKFVFSLKYLYGISDLDVVKLVRDDQIDIAVDLMGYTNNNRMSIFSYRIAPIQINYLGYPGTLGSSSIDYIIADNIIIPKKYEKFYSEKIIRMPHCYQCNDNKKVISKDKFKRTDFQLPEKGIVFTCFNATKKITFKEFDIWMRLLKKVKGSVLWLYKSNKWSVENLYLEAKKRNVDPQSLVFADRLPLEKHLARHSLGDIGLDTFNYNGHTTTSDALWSGLPVLTKIGESFAARVSASLLTSIGLPELITHSEDEYEQLALNLAMNPDKIKLLKDKLRNQRESSNLFNSKLYTKELEQKLKELLS
ncbi:tetratricopeptide repeat protein [Prochlorococcus sp. MIT 0801]|uniref:O-linked N-acetylglucosamine transferase, SPINDLY family protein n=1 Tax=Prochlorococcus sp. MIT 0801 TaxID=1501269 RepID=UPI000691E1DE|nr:tetratricopeptide repeat protein [Prochlorococcus sp. MIT 0801]